MKKSMKGILCGALSILMASSLLAEHVLRTSASIVAPSTTVTANASIENVTGQFDTTQLTTSNFNTKVQETAPKYENRTVMITLSGAPAADLADGNDVSQFVQSWSGQRELKEIAAEQDAFLRKLKKTGISYTLKRQYSTVLNAVAIEVNTKHVKALKQMDGVESVVITTAYAEPKTVERAANGGLATNETNVYDTGIYDSSDYAHYGEGMVVAVLDTGLDYTHAAFQGFESTDVETAWDEEYVKSVLDNYTLTAETKSGTLKASEVYVSEKVPFAYDYADDDPDVYPSYSNHGTHVAGIIGGYDENGYTDKDGVLINETFKGVAPDAQLAIFKVFTDDLDDPDLGGAVADDIIAALEDCVTLGVDVINMSLGTSCGFTTTDDGDSEGEMLNAVYQRIKDAGISLVCAASNDYSSGYGGVFGTNLASNPDSSTVGSPSTFAAALSVASVNGQKARYMVANETAASEENTYVFYEESRDIDGNPFDFMESMMEIFPDGKFEYVVVPGIGQTADYMASVRRLFKDNNGNSLNRVALVKRGDTTFEDKVKVAMQMGAIGVIVYNNVAGVIRMNLGEIDNPVPAISINMNAGQALTEGATGRIGTLRLDPSYEAGPFMSEFSSWGPTHDLTLKPEITAHGGEITSTVPGGYGEQSGTSMASPNMAGFVALARSYIEKELTHLVTKDGKVDQTLVNSLAYQLIMSTASTAYDPDNLPYSPRKQGAGIARMERVIGGTTAYLSTDVETNDYRPKIEVGEDEEKTGVYTLRFSVTNFGTEDLIFTPSHIAMTEMLSLDGLTVNEQAHLLNEATAEWKVDGKAHVGDITVKAGETNEIVVTLSLSDGEKAYIDESFKNGMYVEGFLQLKSTANGQCDLSIPFLAFYGDWEAAPMLDYTAFEVAASEQDGSVKEEDKLKASVWETQPFSSYYNEKYILPMGGYVYLLPDGADPMYVNEEYCSVSRYNEYYGEGNAENYMTSTGIKAVYAGLLRNARIVKYTMYNEDTGEVIIENGEINRVGKAYSGGGSGTPANVELELDPEEYGLVANGRYRMEFEFYMNEPKDGEVCPEENTYAFSFTVDYEAPVLEDARVRYYNYKDGNKEKQRIYLDVDVYDNHYAQALMLCYPKLNSDGETVLQLATEYPTPIRDANKNGRTTVSIDITDIYDYICKEYGNQIYIQIDDYAINTCLYRVQLGDANSAEMPKGTEFRLADGENALTLDQYATHKVALVYGDEYKGSADLSNFLWTSADEKIAEVKNGEIVGISAGNTTVTVSNRKGASYTIDVTVSDKIATTLPQAPSISFGVIKNYADALVKASGTVEVFAGKDIALQVVTEPWYHPMTNLKLVWETSDASVATVDQNGNVKTLKKGVAIVTATVYQNVNGEWEKTLYTTTVFLRVRNEFTVSNYTLTDYNGVGGDVVIPTDMNIWYIGEEAFKDNDNIRSIVIPASVTQINERAFANCSALEEVYFVSKTARVKTDGTEDFSIDWADLSMVYQQAFLNCKKLKKVDLSNVKTITISDECFSGCSSLSEVVDMPSIGTMHHRAFANCTSLTKVDLTGLHMSGEYVFVGCTNLATIKTGKFTAIGKYMFSSCTGLRTRVTLQTPKIGDGAFSGCVNLSGVKFTSPEGEKLSFDIGARAFEDCGKNLNGNFQIVWEGETIRSIGERAFAGSSLKEFGAITGLTSLGADAFANTKISIIYVNDTLDIDNLQILGVPFNGLTLMVVGGTKYKEANGVIYNAEMTKVLFVNPSVVGEFVLPSNVQEIGKYAFSASKVTKVTLSPSVTKIGESAFKNSAIRSIDFNGAAITEIPYKAFFGSKLTAAALPVSVTKIGESAFEGSALAAFSGESVTEISNRAFANCIVLQTIVLPDGVKTMGDRVFAGCTDLTEVTLSSLETLGSWTFYGATKLNKVVFGADATTTGEYTFAGTPVTEVVLGENVERIETGLFYGCQRLTAITLPTSVTEIAAEAFNSCGALVQVVGLENVKTIGDRAFYNTALTELRLTNATKIGLGAFASEGRNGAIKPASYTKITMPVVETIGEFAFLSGNQTSVELPASVRAIGYGAFAASKNLTTITVAADNAMFFAENNVLYRYINKAENTLEIVCYPAALTAAETDGVKAYAIKDGTVLVKAYAFFGVNGSALNKVTLPYSINAIGDSAFLDSGVKEYVFESIQAPVLEAVYRQEIVDRIEAMATDMTVSYYKGYFYTNFAKGIFDYTSYGNTASDLVMHYPSNGTGYDNHIYNTYFGEKVKTSALLEDSTRECISMIEEMATWNVLSWMQAGSGMTVEELTAKSDYVKTARLYYNNTLKNAEQAAYITEELENTLLAVEKDMRVVKQYFNIPIHISSLEVDVSSTHKSQYLVGETFDMTGLVVLIVYDDYSTEFADMSKITLELTRGLSKYDRYVTVSYEGTEEELRVAVTVMEEEEEEPILPPEDSSFETSEDADSDVISSENGASMGGDKKGGFGVGIVIGIVAVIAAVAVVIIVLKKKGVIGASAVSVESSEKSKTDTEQEEETVDENTTSEE